MDYQVRVVFLIKCYIVAFCALNSLQAQVQNDQDVYISDNSVFYIGSQSFDFGSGSISTSRTKVGYGVMSFSEETTFRGASDTHYVDGYAQTVSKSAFILPIGQDGFYAPVQVTPFSADGVDAAYFRTAADTIGTILDESVAAVSTVEYWDIKSTGVAAGFSLSWRPSSGIADLTSFSLTALSIVGWNGFAWIPIPSTVDEFSILGEASSLVSGSISSNAVLDLNAYSAFSLGTVSKKQEIAKDDKIKVIAFAKGNRLVIESSLPITSLSIYNISGKQIFTKHLDGSKKYDQPFNYPQTLYVAKIELSNGSSVQTKKILNIN